eukprot:274428-Chlamydomonas_euryale.AAC.2
MSRAEPGSAREAHKSPRRGRNRFALSSGRAAAGNDVAVAPVLGVACPAAETIPGGATLRRRLSASSPGLPESCACRA